MLTLKLCFQRHEESSARWISRQVHLRVTNQRVNVSLMGECVQGEEPLFSRDGRSFFITLPVRHFNHVTMITTQVCMMAAHLRLLLTPPHQIFLFLFQNDRDDVQHLTSGDWEVTRILAFNEEDHIV